MSLSELHTIFRVFLDERRRQQLRPLKIAQRQRGSRIVEKKRRGSGLQNQGFIEQQCSVDAIARHAIPECQLVQGVREKRAVLFCGFIEFARALQFLGANVVLPQ